MKTAKQKNAVRIVWHPDALPVDDYRATGFRLRHPHWRDDAGQLDGITDVPGIKVRQTTLIKADSIRTGVTAILPHGGNLFSRKYRQRCTRAMVSVNWPAPRR